MVSLTLDLPPEITAGHARILLALKLFEEHLVSMGKAAEIAECSKQKFMELAGRHGVAIFDHPPGELERELSM